MPEPSPEFLLIIRQTHSGWKLHYIDCDLHDAIDCLKAALASLEADHEKQHEEEAQAETN